MRDSGLRRWRPSRIGLRLLAFNILVVFAPALGVLYLDAYESHLRQAQENAMAQQARIVAAAIAEDSAGGALDAPRFERTLARLERRTDARFRVYDVTGTLVADSARAAEPASVESAKYGPDATDTRSRPLYRASARLVNAVKVAKEAVRGWLHGTPKVPQTAGTDPVQAELRTALAGRYGAAIRVTPGQRSLTMFSAVPVQRDGAVIAAVVASQSTYRILRALYDVRLRLIEIVMASLIVAAALTALAATTIVRPLARLQKQASTLAERRGPWTGTFPGASRKDELGDLARALGELARRTNDHMALLQSFSADVSHELKNPLASIRTAAEMMAGADSDRERERFLQLMIRDVARLERLVSSLRDVAIVERQIEHEAMTPVDLDGVLREIVDAARRSAGAHVSIELSTAAACAVRASRERLAQVFDNLIANAVSFAPDGTSVTVRSSADASRAVVIVEDSGPGIPESHMDRIFARFFTYRPVQGRGEHVGLGLAIASQIVQSYGGDIVAANREEGGARFVVRLPRAGV